MIKIRKSAERGQADHGWLLARHSFSFGDYFDRDHMGFRALRVINEDRVAPARGFGTHPHRDMEIVTYVLEGELEHRDSMGNGAVIRPGEVQYMSAGSGVLHSEQNPSEKNGVHLLQIWLLPNEKNATPRYDQKNFSEADKLGKLRLVASEDGKEGSVAIRQDVRLYASVLDQGQKAELPLPAGRHGWIQVARGGVEVNGQRLEAGDGAAISDEKSLRFVATSERTEFLVFDLA